MKKTYTATFTDGTVLKRKTERTYAYAWSVKFWVETEDWRTKEPYCGLVERDGFSRTRELAIKAKNNFDGWKTVVRVVRNEVAPAIEVIK